MWLKYKSKQTKHSKCAFNQNKVQSLATYSSPEEWRPCHRTQKTNWVVRTLCTLTVCSSPHTKPCQESSLPSSVPPHTCHHLYIQRQSSSKQKLAFPARDKRCLFWLRKYTKLQLTFILHLKIEMLIENNQTNLRESNYWRRASTPPENN